jgi:hypothetical protein
VTAILVDGIGELVTNDPELGDGSSIGLVRDAAMLVEGGLVRWQVNGLSPRRPMIGWTWQVQRSSRGSSTRMRI